MYDLWSASGDQQMRLTALWWDCLLDLAEFYGWQPSMPPPYYGEQGGQTVAAGEARAMAAAIEKAMLDVPTNDAVSHKVEAMTAGGRTVRLLLAGAECSPWEAFSGPGGRGRLQQFIRLARAGSFSIW